MSKPLRPRPVSIAPQPPEPPEPKEPPTEPDELMEVLLAEIRSLCEAQLPQMVREDVELAAMVFLETHPVMRERLDALRARRMNQSDTLAVRKSSPPTEQGLAAASGEAGVAARRKRGS